MSHSTDTNNTNLGVGSSTQTLRMSAIKSINFEGGFGGGHDLRMSEVGLDEAATHHQQGRRSSQGRSRGEAEETVSFTQHFGRSSQDEVVVTESFSTQAPPNRQESQMTEPGVENDDHDGDESPPFSWVDKAGKRNKKPLTESDAFFEDTNSDGSGVKGERETTNDTTGDEEEDPSATAGGGFVFPTEQSQNTGGAWNSEHLSSSDQTAATLHNLAATTTGVFQNSDSLVNPGSPVVPMNSSASGLRDSGHLGPGGPRRRSRRRSSLSPLVGNLEAAGISNGASTLTDSSVLPGPGSLQQGGPLGRSGSVIGGNAGPLGGANAASRPAFISPLLPFNAFTQEEIIAHKFITLANLLHCTAAGSIEERNALMQRVPGLDVSSPGSCSILYHSPTRKGTSISVPQPGDAAAIDMEMKQKKKPDDDEDDSSGENAPSPRTIPSSPDEMSSAKHNKLSSDFHVDPVEFSETVKRLLRDCVGEFPRLVHMTIQGSPWTTANNRVSSQALGRRSPSGYLNGSVRSGGATSGMSGGAGTPATMDNGATASKIFPLMCDVVTFFIDLFQSEIISLRASAEQHVRATMELDAVASVWEIARISLLDQTADISGGSRKKSPNQKTAADLLRHSREWSNILLCADDPASYLPQPRGDGAPSCDQSGAARPVQNNDFAVELVCAEELFADVYDKDGGSKSGYKQPSSSTSSPSFLSSLRLESTNTATIVLFLCLLYPAFSSLGQGLSGTGNAIVGVISVIPLIVAAMVVFLARRGSAMSMKRRQVRDMLAAHQMRMLISSRSFIESFAANGGGSGAAGVGITNIQPSKSEMPAAQNENSNPVGKRSPPPGISLRKPSPEPQHLPMDGTKTTVTDFSNSMSVAHELGTTVTSVTGGVGGTMEASVFSAASGRQQQPPPLAPVTSITIGAQQQSQQQQLQPQQRSASKAPNPLSHAVFEEMLPDGTVKVEVDPTGTFLLPFSETDPILLDGLHIHKHLAMVGIEFTRPRGSHDQQHFTHNRSNTHSGHFRQSSSSGFHKSNTELAESYFDHDQEDDDDRYAICLWNQAIAEFTGGGFTSEVVMSQTLSQVVADDSSYDALVTVIEDIENEILNPEKGLPTEPLMVRLLHSVNGVCALQVTVSPVTRVDTVPTEEGGTEEREMMMGALIVGVPVDPNSNIQAYEFRSSYLSLVMEECVASTTAIQEYQKRESMKQVRRSSQQSAGIGGEDSNSNSQRSDQGLLQVIPITNVSQDATFRLALQLNEYSSFLVAQKLGEFDTLDDGAWEPIYSECISTLILRSFSALRVSCIVKEQVPPVVVTNIKGITQLLHHIMLSLPLQERGVTITIDCPGGDSTMLVCSILACDFNKTMLDLRHEITHLVGNSYENALLSQLFDQIGGHFLFLPTDPATIAELSAQRNRTSVARTSGASSVGGRPAGMSSLSSFAAMLSNAQPPQAAVNSSQDNGNNNGAVDDFEPYDLHLFIPFYAHTGTQAGWERRKTHQSSTAANSPGPGASSVVGGLTSPSASRKVSTGGAIGSSMVHPHPVLSSIGDSSTNGQIRRGSSSANLHVEDSSSAHVNMSVMLCEPNMISRHKISRLLWEEGHAVNAIDINSNAPTKAFAEVEKLLQSGIRTFDVVILASVICSNGSSPAEDSTLLRLCENYQDIVFILRKDKERGVQKKKNNKKKPTASQSSTTADPAVKPIGLGIGVAAAAAAAEEENKQPDNLHIINRSHSHNSLKELVDYAQSHVLVVRERIKKQQEIARVMKEHRTSPWVKGKKLGKGTFGDVFEAILTLTGGKMAVKICRMPSSDQERIDIAMNELAILSQIQHPHIVQYFYCTQAEDNTNEINIFMELCGGGSLADLIKKEKKFSEDEIATIAQQVLSALAYLHDELKLAHRDIKPANILMSEGKAKLADFGTAKATTNDKNGGFKDTAGTFIYMAPEVINGAEYGLPCDLWSVGCVLLELFGSGNPSKKVDAGSMCGYFADCKTDAEVTRLLSKVENPVAIGFLSEFFHLRPEDRQTASELLQHSFIFDRRMNLGLTRRQSVSHFQRQSTARSVGALSIDSGDWDVQSRRDFDDVQQADSVEASQVSHSTSGSPGIAPAPMGSNTLLSNPPAGFASTSAFNDVTSLTINSGVQQHSARYSGSGGALLSKLPPAMRASMLLNPDHDRTDQNVFRTAYSPTPNRRSGGGGIFMQSPTKRTRNRAAGIPLTPNTLPKPPSQAMLGRLASNSHLTADSGSGQQVGQGGSTFQQVPYSPPPALNRLSSGSNQSSSGLLSISSSAGYQHSGAVVRASNGSGGDEGQLLPPPPPPPARSSGGSVIPNTNPRGRNVAAGLTDPRQRLTLTAPEHDDTVNLGTPSGGPSPHSPKVEGYGEEEEEEYSPPR